VAAREGKLEIIKYYISDLLDKIDINIKMLDGWTPFFYAAVNGYLISVDVFYKHPYCNVNAVDKFNRNALHWVARYNNKTMVKKLLDIGVNYEEVDVEGLTPFELAR
jgi:ankyrin repeat protein